MSNIFQENKLIYVPIATEQAGDVYKFKTNLNKGDKLNWWSSSSYMKYNAMLVSAYYGRKSFENRREIRDNVLFIGDSGGYQIVQHRSDEKVFPGINKLTWKNVIKWQLDVSDIGMTLDIPPIAPHKAKKMNKDYHTEYEKSLKESTTNALEMHKWKESHLPEAENPDFKLFNVIHGTNPKEMNRWYKETTDNFNVEYDGFSSSSACMGPNMSYLLPLRLGFLIENSKEKPMKGKPFHILGTSSPRNICLIAYANKKFTKTQVYFDSTAVNKARTHREYFWYFDFTGPVFYYGKDENKHTKLSDICVCPICSSLNKKKDIWAHRFSGYLIELHNLYWTTNYIEYINELVNHEKKFMAYVKRFNNSSKILNSMEFLDEVYENDLNTAWEKYKNIINCSLKQKPSKKKF
jgi:tRNA-guanine family transglycosylase